MKGLTEGRIVHYVLTQIDADAINDYRDSYNSRDRDSLPACCQQHIGNPVRKGDHCPMMVVRVWDQQGGTVNGQVFLDGNDSYWVTSVYFDDEKTTGTWHWIEPA
jgi:hypothetical protein